MTDNQLAIQMLTDISRLLEQHWAARGRTLHARISAAEPMLPPPLVRKLRFIATLGGQLERSSASVGPADVRNLLVACRDAQRQLERLAAESARASASPDFAATVEAEVFTSTSQARVMPPLTFVERIRQTAAAIRSRPYLLPVPPGPVIQGGAPTRRLWMLMINWALISVATTAIGLGVVIAGGATATFAATALTALAAAIMLLVQAITAFVLLLFWIGVAGGVVLLGLALAVSLAPLFFKGWRHASRS